jgi:DNA-binding LytR/AlgR family response regulator
MISIREKINNYLDEPYTLFLLTTKGMMLLIFAVPIFGVLINLLQPFGIHAWHAPHKWMVLAGYGILYAGMYILIYRLGSTFFPTHYTAESWTVRKELCVLALYFPLTIVSGCIFTVVSVPKVLEDKLTLFELIGYNMLMAAMAVSVFGLVVKVRLGKRIVDRADNPMPEAQPNAEPESEDMPEPELKNEPEPESGSIQVSTDELMSASKPLSEPEPQSELPVAETPLPFPTTPLPVFIEFKKMSYKVSDIVYLESSGNKMIIHVLAGGQMKESIVLYTLKKAEKDLALFPQMKRCHDSFIVNLDYVVAFKNKNHGLELTLQHCNSPIPASSSYDCKLIENRLYDRGIFRK